MAKAAPEEASLGYTVGHVARMLGCSASTVRRFEDNGLISPRRTRSGYRIFDPTDLERLQRIAYFSRVGKLNSAAIRRMVGGQGETHRRASRDRTELGNQLKRVRKERKVTLEQAAAGSNLSPSFISSIERGTGGVSFPSLQRILTFYGTTVAQMLDPKGGRSSRLVRANRRRVLVDRFAGVKVEQLAASDSKMEVHLYTVQPGGSSEGGYSHEGEEFMFVLTGRFDVTLVVGERYHLRQGDCLYFPSTIEHSWRNPGRVSTVLLYVNTPPTF